MVVKSVCLGFGLLVKCNKTFEDVTLGGGKLFSDIQSENNFPSVAPLLFSIPGESVMPAVKNRFLFGRCSNVSLT